MTANDDDNPHYDDLIRELRELKRFIESNGDNAVSSPAPAGVESRPDKSRRGGTDAARPATTADTGSDRDDEPPTLREAVRRPAGRDEMQLDLLSVSRFEADETAAEAAGADAAPGVDQPTRADADAEMPAPRSAARDARSAPTGAALVPPTEDEDEDDDIDIDDAADDEVVRFVLDLSDRILGTIEDKLLEHSGELLPGELRGELREAIGDILYEWCER